MAIENVNQFNLWLIWNKNNWTINLKQEESLGVISFEAEKHHHLVIYGRLASIWSPSKQNVSAVCKKYQWCLYCSLLASSCSIGSNERFTERTSAEEGGREEKQFEAGTKSIRSLLRVNLFSFFSLQTTKSTFPSRLPMQSRKINLMRKVFPRVSLSASISFELIFIRFSTGVGWSYGRQAEHKYSHAV